MFKTKLIITITIFVIFLVVTSAIKNETRILEKKISHLNAKIKIQRNNINEAQLDFYYLSSPANIEKKLNITGFNEYQPIKFSNIYFDINDFIKVNNIITDLKKSNEKEIQKR
tara:strand:- start:756 stop:1094 length:339 start_codon:yes stop_codon:yes gene_type:complete